VKQAANACALAPPCPDATAAIRERADLAGSACAVIGKENVADNHSRYSHFAPCRVPLEDANLIFAVDSFLK
jgi:hypothetical protein